MELNLEKDGIYYTDYIKGKIVTKKIKANDICKYLNYNVVVRNGMVVKEIVKSLMEYNKLINLVFVGSLKNYTFEDFYNQTKIEVENGDYDDCDCVRMIPFCSLSNVNDMKDLEFGTLFNAYPTNKENKTRFALNSDISNWKHVILAELRFCVDFLEVVVKDGLFGLLLLLMVG